MSLRRLAPVLVTVLTAVLALGWVAATTVPVRATDPTLPPDGLVAQVERGDGSLVQVEQAVLPAAALTGALGEAVGAGLGATDTALRLTFTPDAPGDQVVLAHDGDRLALHGLALGDVGRRWIGGLPLVAGDATGRVHAVGGGDDAERAFRASVSTADVGDGCTEVSAAVEPDGGAAERVLVTVCDGRGVTALRLETEGEDLGFAPTDAPVPFAESLLAVDDRDWADADAWVPEAAVPTATDPFGSLVGARAQVGAPAALLSGALAVVDGVSDDVVVHEPGADGVAAVAWRGHPGGQVAGVVAVGDLVVALRTGGSMVAYSIDGVRVWSSDAAPESVVGTMVPSTGRLALATLDGTVTQLDAVTGEPLWTHGPADRFAIGAVGDERVTFAADTTGRIFGWTPDGEQVFWGEVPSAFEIVALDEAHSYLGRGGTVEAYELQYSQFRWATDVGGGLREICSTTDRVVVSAAGAVSLLDPATGAVVGSVDPADAIVCGAGAVALLRGTVVEMLTTDGASQELQVDTPPVGLGVRGVVAAPDGLWVVTERAFVWWAR